MIMQTQTADKMITNAINIVTWTSMNFEISLNKGESTEQKIPAKWSIECLAHIDPIMAWLLFLGEISQMGKSVKFIHVYFYIIYSPIHIQKDRKYVLYMIFTCKIYNIFLMQILYMTRVIRICLLQTFSIWAQASCDQEQVRSQTNPIDNTDSISD